MVKYLHVIISIMITYILDATVMQRNVGYKFILKQLIHVIRQNSATGFNLSGCSQFKIFVFQIHELANPKAKKPKEIPSQYEVCCANFVMTHFSEILKIKS